VRHARGEALDELEPLLAALRDLPALRERSRGVFYRGGHAFLHFHEDPTGLHADVRLAKDLERFRVQTSRERDALLARVRRALAPAPVGTPLARTALAHDGPRGAGPA
jgi:hypothetical protein